MDSSLKHQGETLLFFLNKIIDLFYIPGKNTKMTKWEGLIIAVDLLLHLIKWLEKEIMMNSLFKYIGTPYKFRA